jgi:hypothetical protein
LTTALAALDAVALVMREGRSTVAAVVARRGAGDSGQLACWRVRFRLVVAVSQVGRQRLVSVFTLFRLRADPNSPRAKYPARSPGSCEHGVTETGRYGVLSHAGLGLKMFTTSTVRKATLIRRR